MKNIYFTSTKLAQYGKKGEIKKLDSGYYEIAVGGLNAYNSANEFYTLQGAQELFKESSILTRRIEKGVVCSELGHPKPVPGMTETQFIERILTIEETNTIAHIRKLTLDHEYGKRNPHFNNPQLVAIIAELAPSGPHAAALERSMNNPHENVCFSIRGMTTNVFSRGRTLRTLNSIITFDKVTEPGIAAANKWDTPSCEAATLVSESTDSLNMLVNEERIEDMLSRSSGISTENTRELLKETANIIRISSLPTLPIYTNWK